MQAMRYYIKEGPEKQGPFDIKELRELAAKGELTTEDVLTTEDGTARIRAGLVVGVFGPPGPDVKDEAEESLRAVGGKPVAHRRFLVAAVFLLLAGLLLPFAATLFVVPLMQQKVVRDREQVRRDLGELVKATLAYAADNDDRLPPVFNGSETLGPLLPKSYRPVPSGTRAEGRGEFAANRTLAATRLSDLKSPKRTLLFYETLPWSDGKRVAATSDGNVKTVDDAEFRLLEASLQP